MRRGVRAGGGRARQRGRRLGAARGGARGPQRRQGLGRQLPPGHQRELVAPAGRPNRQPVDSSFTPGQEWWTKGEEEHNCAGSPDMADAMRGHCRHETLSRPRQRLFANAAGGEPAECEPGFEPTRADLLRGAPELRRRPGLRPPHAGPFASAQRPSASTQAPACARWSAPGRSAPRSSTAPSCAQEDACYSTQEPQPDWGMITTIELTVWSIFVCIFAAASAASSSTSTRSRGSSTGSTTAARTWGFASAGAALRPGPRPLSDIPRPWLSCGSSLRVGMPGGIMSWSLWYRSRTRGARPPYFWCGDFRTCMGMLTRPQLRYKLGIRGEFRQDAISAFASLGSFAFRCRACLANLGGLGESSAVNPQLGESVADACGLVDVL